MIPRRNRDLPFVRNSFLFSYKRRYNGNLCVCSVQQAKAASSMMTCTLSAPAAYFCQQRCFAQGRVSDGILFVNSSKKYEKMPPETDGFWTSFTFKRLACYETVKGIDSATDPLPLPLR